MKNTFVTTSGNTVNPSDISAAILRVYNNGDKTKFMSHSASTLRNLVSTELNVASCGCRHCA